MRRAERLFQIVQILRRRPITRAIDLATELQVSERTIYRDIQDLGVSGVPIQGQAGLGYALLPGFDVPPLMFTEDEIEALVLGARMVRAWADSDLAKAANDALDKVEGVLPERLRGLVATTTLFAPTSFGQIGSAAHLAKLRTAARRRRKVRLAYTDAKEVATTRVVAPLGLFFWGKVWTLAAWCELRDGYRNFRVDRIEDLDLLQYSFADEPGRDVDSYFRHIREEWEARPE